MPVRSALRTCAGRRSKTARSAPRQLRIRAETDMIDSNHIDQGADVVRVLQRGVSQVCPHAHQTTGLRNELCMFFADAARPHHLRHAGVAAELGIQPRMRDDDWRGRDLQRRLCRLRARMGKIDQHPESVAFLDDGGTKGRDPTEAWRIGVHIAERR